MIRRATGTLMAAATGLLTGAFGLAVTFVVHLVITAPLPRQISRGTVVALSAGYLLAALASGLAGAWVTWGSALRRGGSVQAALVLLVPLFLVLAWIALRIISFTNVCHFNDGFPLANEPGRLAC